MSRVNVRTRWTFVGVAMLVACAPAHVPAARGEPMAMLVPALDTLWIDGLRVVADRELPSAMRVQAIRSLRARFPEGRGVRGLYQVPHLAARWLIVASGEEHERDHGYRLFLVEPGPAGAAIIAQTPGEMDADWIDPVWFVGAGRTLLLADVGSESSWGIIAYEVTAAGLRALGNIPAAKPGPPETGWHGSALPYATVLLTPAGYVVEFAGDVMLDPAGLGERLIRGSRRSPVRFRWTAGKFVLEP